MVPCRREMAGALVSGYWHTSSDGKREWREKPRCKCGGELDFRRSKDPDAVPLGGILISVVCKSCGKLEGEIAKPTQADLDRGAQLAERFGWE